MKEVGVLEAKTHLSALLEEVSAGAEVLITRHGKAIARLMPCEPQPRDRRAAVADMRALRNELETKYGPDPDFDWRAAVNEGRP
ncbi:MAG TPA: type II toxin-antitoxin system prevent-host-death family antitoxin [Caulobacteraceae bacterium]|jgi:prevent-host-death family protein